MMPTWMQDKFAKAFQEKDIRVIKDLNKSWFWYLNGGGK